ncbi:MAG: ABC transporter ATP-binding protein [Parvularculaceae bacterium]
MSLILENIRHRFGAVEALAGASLDVSAGEIVCLFGPSGCGKTTLLRLIAGLEPLQSGRIDLDGQTLSDAVPPEKRPIGFVFQDFVLFPHLTAAENVAFGLSGGPRRDLLEQARKELKSVGLEDVAARFPHELSGGQQQRVALARALVRRPRAMLLDEPFASIDAVLRRRLREGMRAMLKEYGAATLFVTHDPDEAVALGDRIAIMKEGHIVETATPLALFSSPLTPEGAAVFTGAQRLEGRSENGIVRTAFGAFRGANRVHGPVSVIALPGALGLVADAGGPASIVSSRFTGPRWTSTVVAPDAPAPLLVETGEPAEITGRVRVEFDPFLTKVFAADP